MSKHLVYKQVPPLGWYMDARAQRLIANEGVSQMKGENAVGVT